MILRGILTGILMVALTFVGFGHQTLSPQTEAQADAYILAGGDWSDLCGEGGDPLAHVTKCIACLITHGCALPSTSDVAMPLGFAVRPSWAVDQSADHVLSANSLHSARAPPFHIV